MNTFSFVSAVCKYQKKNPWVRETFWCKPWLGHSRAKSRKKNMGFQTKWTIHFIGLNPQFCFSVGEYLSFLGTECSKRRSSKRGDTLNISNPGPPGKKYLHDCHDDNANMSWQLWEKFAKVLRACVKAERDVAPIIQRSTMIIKPPSMVWCLVCCC